MQGTVSDSDDNKLKLIISKSINGILTVEKWLGYAIWFSLTGYLSVGQDLKLNSTAHRGFVGCFILTIFVNLNTKSSDLFSFSMATRVTCC